MKGIDFVQTDDKLYLKLTAQEEHDRLTPADLHSIFDQSPVHRCQLFDDAFSKALSDASASGASLLHIGYCLPAQLEFDISADEMEVKAKVTAPWGGDPVDMNQLLKLLREHGITLGIRRHSMDK